MKKIFKTFAFIAGVVLILSACDEYNELTAPPPADPGDADFSRFVTIGNSITAGYQSSSLYKSVQQYSYGQLIANVMAVSFEQPIVSDPGTGGRLEIDALDFSTNSIDIVSNPNAGTPQNLNYPAPYNNLGVPGAFMWDVLNATNSSDNFTAQFGVPNPMFDLILRNSALNIGSQFLQAQALNPTFVTLWIGNNDVLGYATSGGTTIPIPTPVATFTGLYEATAAAIASLGADVVVGNIPDVSTIPFFTTVGPGIGLNLQVNQIPGLVYGKTGGAIGVATVDDLFTGNVLILLTGSSATVYIGDVTGAYYTDNGIPVPPEVNTAFPFGLAPENPWPNNLTLDPDEITIATEHVNDYNNAIANTADTSGFGHVDFNTIFKTIRQNDFTEEGTVINGISFRTTFVLGGLFSLDGVHPTSQGQAIIANEFIKTTNTKFNASIPLIDVSTIPGSLVLTKGGSMGKYGIPIIPHGALDHVLF